MLYREIIAVCSEIHTKHINTLCGQNIEFLNVKPGGSYIKRQTFKGSTSLAKYLKEKTRFKLHAVESVPRDKRKTKNGSVFWGRRGPRKGCSPADGMESLYRPCCMAVYHGWKGRNEKVLYSHRNLMVECSPQICPVLRSAKRIHNTGAIYATCV